MFSSIKFNGSTEVTSNIGNKLQEITQGFASSKSTTFLEEDSKVNAHFTLKLGPVSGKGFLKVEAKVVSEENALTEETVQVFCQAVQKLGITYQDRFHFTSENNTYASEKLVKEIKETFLPLHGKVAANLFWAKPQLKEQIQLALMELLRRLYELEAKNLANKYPEISLDCHKMTLLGNNFDSLSKFQQYIKQQCYGAKKHLITFRYLFPLVAPNGSVPAELHQSKIKPFIDLVEKVFQLTFSEDKLECGASLTKWTP